MAEIIAGPLDWVANDEENLARFLDTETGKRFLPKLMEEAPLLLERGHVNAILIRSGEVRGFQNVVRTILALAHPAPKGGLSPVEKEYPSLTDDAAWNDGQKLEPVPDKPPIDII
jgi:hypothetical protein